MSMKGWFYAALEGIQQAIGDSGELVFMYEYQGPNATAPGLPDIDLEKKYGKGPTGPLGRMGVGHSGIDEMWYTAAAMGSALVGIPSVFYLDMYMANSYPFELIFDHAAKYHYMTGGQATVPAVFWLGLDNTWVGGAGQHADYNADSWYMNLSGVHTVIPTTVYDIKGLMVSAIQSGDPVVLLNFAGFRALVEDVPDTLFSVPIGKAALRTTGSDITIVGSGGGMPKVMQATARLQKEGVGVDAIDLRTLKPLDTETLVKSAQKTGRVVVHDEGKWTLGPGAQVVAEIAEGAPGTKFKRLSFPDAPPAGAPEMVTWQRPTAEQTYQAAKALLNA